MPDFPPPDGAGAAGGGGPAGASQAALSPANASQVALFVKSNKQRRAEIVLRRRKRAEKKAAVRKVDPRTPEIMGADTAPCNPALLAPHNSYGPRFVLRGYYVDEAFQCAGCKSEEVWRATQQKWWYEVARGNVESRAKLCRACRRTERERSAGARRIHLEGVARKAAARRKT